MAGRSLRAVQNGLILRPPRIRVSYNQVPRGFDPKTIDSRLPRGGYDLTLLSIWHVVPEGNLFENTDEVIHTVREMILSDHMKEEFKATEVAAPTNIDADEVALVFELK